MLRYGDPSWYQGFNSPYYNDSHVRFRKAVREYVERELMPNCHEWEEAKSLAPHTHRKLGQAGILAGLSGMWPKEFAGESIAGGVKPEEWNFFHEMILLDELCRIGSVGVVWGIISGVSIALPTLLHFAKPELKQRICGPVARGEKMMGLCITEPWAGSDVSGLQSTAKLSPDRTHYVVNGEKKWITNGAFADYFSVAVRTGPQGMKGISMLLIEKSMPGVTVRPMKCGGAWSSGTAYITFEDVQVPVQNLIGNENEGFKYIMSNFNHERWSVICQSVRFARVCYEEAFKYACKRETFGKTLIDQPVIRAKLGTMARSIEATQAHLEQITYQMTIMSYDKIRLRLAGPIALLKVQATQLFDLCTREATQVFGGLGYTRGGQGEKVERLYRDVRAIVMGGGSEEIMLDLGMRQAATKFSKL